MRHNRKIKKLNRNTNQRKALFKNLLASLFSYSELKTSVTKGKIVKKMADHLISKALKGSNLAVRRQIIAVLPQEKIANKLIDEIAPLFKGINGGYTRLVRIGVRRGDGTVMVKVELTKKTAKKTAALPKALKDNNSTKKKEKNCLLGLFRLLGRFLFCH